MVVDLGVVDSNGGQRVDEGGIIGASCRRPMPTPAEVFPLRVAARARGWCQVGRSGPCGGFCHCGSTAPRAKTGGGFASAGCGEGAREGFQTGSGLCRGSLPQCPKPTPAEVLPPPGAARVHVGHQVNSPCKPNEGEDKFAEVSVGQVRYSDGQFAFSGCMVRSEVGVGSQQAPLHWRCDPTLASASAPRRLPGRHLRW